MARSESPLQFGDDASHACRSKGTTAGFRDFTDNFRAQQLGNLLDSPLLAHIDWNIKNFVFRERDERLFYVDLKPTTFVAAGGNERNLKAIREYFVG